MSNRFKDAITNSKLHHLIITQIIETGRAPTISEMATMLETTPKLIKTSLQGLQNYHGVVLHPHNDEVWICHPFSLAPTNFRISSKSGSWYGTCAWCSLGAAGLLGGDIDITTILADTGKPVIISIRNNELCDNEGDLCIHFPIKMVKAWDNVVYTCQCMQLFSCADGIKTWSSRHLPTGPNLSGTVQPLSKCFHFAREWYALHADPNWIKWTTKEAVAIFKRHGLEGNIWEMPESANHF